MSLQLDGLDLLSAISNGGPGIRIQVVRGFLSPAEVRGEDYTVAARAGRSRGNRVEDSLEVVLAGYVVGADVAGWRSYTDFLLAKITAMQKVEANLVAVNYLGHTGTATLTCLVKNYIPGEIVNKTRQTWNIALEAIDPPNWVLT